MPAASQTITIWFTNLSLLLDFELKLASIHLYATENAFFDGELEVDVSLSIENSPATYESVSSSFILADVSRNFQKTADDDQSCV